MGRVATLKRLTRLRDLLRFKKLDGYLLGSEDEHFNEYVDPSDRRYSFISGFTGSTCTIIITMNQAALWTDSRYLLQASQQLDENWQCISSRLEESSISNWIVKNTHSSALIGYDNTQLSFTTLEKYKSQIRQAEVVNGDPTSGSRMLIETPGPNLVDLVWDEYASSDALRPKRPCNPLILLPTSFTGCTWQLKLERVRGLMQKNHVQIFVAFALDEIAWLFNLRGSDIQCNPVFYSYAIIRLDKVDLFLNPQTVIQTPKLMDYLKDDENEVQIYPYNRFLPHLKSTCSTGRVWLDPLSSQAIVNQIPEPHCWFHLSPIASLKSVKTQSELSGIRHAHVTDSFALCEFLAWLDDVAVKSGEGPLNPNLVEPVGSLKPPPIMTEASIASYLDSIRRQARDFVSLSFETIVGADANGAVIHYHPKMGEDAPIGNSSLVLVDSGAHYLTGTTDVTRTIHMSQPTLEQKHYYTAVLKAHISLAVQKFPSNTPGSFLDVVARRNLWNLCLDYGHGTGHGVGAFLCVHEGPFGMSGSRLNSFLSVGFREPGMTENMVVTIEPGYYWTDNFGIRLENVFFVVPVVESSNATTDTPSWVTFKPVTLVPFEPKLIDCAMLDKGEIAWLNNYNQHVRQTLVQYIYDSCDRSLVNYECANLDLLTTSYRRCLKWIFERTAVIG